MRKLVSVCALVLFALTAPLAQAKDTPGKGNGNGKGNSGGSDTSVSVDIRFGSSAESTIRSYFRDYPMTPQALPPGMYNRLAQGKPLPPGIAKRYVPDGLRVQLPGYGGSEVVIVGRDVMLIAAGTAIILDILRDVL